MYEICLKLPLYGKTRAINLVRSLNVARINHGCDPLPICNLGWKSIICMHKNVKEAAKLLDVIDYESAEEACTIFSVLMRASYCSEHSRKGVTKMEASDLAVVMCEYKVVQRCANTNSSQNLQSPRTSNVLSKMPLWSGQPRVCCTNPVHGFAHF